MAEEPQKVVITDEAKHEKEEEKAKQEQAIKDGDIVLVREAINAKKQRVAAGTVLEESEEWPKHRILFMLSEGHAKMKGAEPKNTDAKEQYLAQQRKAAQQASKK